MQYDFPTEYSHLTDGELLHLASSRHTLVPEASAALDAELRRRNLTESDRIEHRRHYQRQERLQVRRSRRITFGVLKDRMTWRDILGAFGMIAILLVAYFALPRRYHMKPEWQEATFYVMMTTVLIVAASKNTLWRTITFWMSLGISTAIHFVIVLAWTKRFPGLDRGQAKLAALLGLALFIPTYKLVSVLQRIFYDKEASNSSLVADGLSDALNDSLQKNS